MLVGGSKHGLVYGSLLQYTHIIILVQMHDSSSKVLFKVDFSIFHDAL